MIPRARGSEPWGWLTTSCSRRTPVFRINIEAQGHPESTSMTMEIERLERMVTLISAATQRLTRKSRAKPNPCHTQEGCEGEEGGQACRAAAKAPTK